MKLTLTYPLYKRKTASNEIAPLGYLPEGSVITVDDIVVGKPIDGNSVWYKADEGIYYWSGGIDTVEFSFPGKDFFALSRTQQFTLVSQAMDHYYAYLSTHIEGFTGASVAFKKTDDTYRNHYALAVQVIQKTGQPSFELPRLLPYYGYLIPTDVIVASPTESSALGDSLSRQTIASNGSAGFITTRVNGQPAEMLLITNYHVACADLMLRSPRKLSLLQNDVINKPEMVMPARGNPHSKVIGKVVEGRLDLFNDIAVVLLTDTAIDNTINNIGMISGIRTVDELMEDFQPETIVLKMFGARSHLTQGTIVSFNATQPISYFNGALIHVLKGLIQATKMSQPGDSGSAVVDSGNALVGILVASDNTFSYILPIENILDNFTLNQLS